MSRAFAAGLGIVLAGLVSSGAAENKTSLAPGVRGLATRAPADLKVDGRLDEWEGAFCTPLHYNHRHLEDRATQVFALWDEEALYIGLRALDRKPANLSPSGTIYNGDAVEFYVDARSGQALRGKDWTEGAVHLYFTPFNGTAIEPRWEVRRGIATSDVKLAGVELAATSHEWGYEEEFKLPWANFPDFQPRPGSLLGLDVELCSGDGAKRTDRTFNYGSPLSVQQPASQGTVELVERFDRDDLAIVGPSAFPFWVETPWIQPDRAEVRATVGIPPSFIDEVGKVEVRIHDVDGRIVRTIPAAVERFGPEGAGFARAVAHWSIDDFAPNTYFATAQVKSKSGEALTTVAPRMVAEAIITGR